MHQASNVIISLTSKNPPLKLEEGAILRGKRIIMCGVDIPGIYYSVETRDTWYGMTRDCSGL